MDALFAMHDAYTNRASSLSTDLATYKGFFEQIISAREAKALVKKQEKDAYLAGLASTLAADDRIIKRERTVCSTEESLYTATLYHGINTGNSYNNRDNAQSNAASFIAGVGTMLVCAASSPFFIGNIGFKFVGEVKAITEFYTKNRSTSVGVRYVDGNDDKSPVFYSTEAACKAYSGSAEFLVVPTSIVGVWVDASASEADVALANTLASQLGVEVVRTWYRKTS